MNKNNIIKINIEILNNHQLKNALVSAIHALNKTDSIKIIDKYEKYKIRLSKKSGLPDLDSPSKIIFYFSRSIRKFET